MELKDTKKSEVVGSIHGFNRTFMELKDKNTYTVTLLIASFNRTFMELKGKRRTQVSSRGAFQSHLYGIESVDVLKDALVLHVSIAPLWN